MLVNPIWSILALVAVNGLSILVGLWLARGGRAAVSAPAAPKHRDGKGTDDAVMTLVEEVERLEAARAASLRGEARLAADVGRWKGTGGSNVPPAAASCRRPSAGAVAAGQGGR